MSRYIHSQQATNKAFKNLDFSDVGTIQALIWSNVAAGKTKFFEFIFKNTNLRNLVFLGFFVCLY